jgi:hypothetical protein
MADKLRPPELLIGAASLLLLGSTFLPWFSLPGAAELSKQVAGSQLVGGASDSAVDFNVWDLPVARFWVYLVILLGIGLVLAALFSPTPGWSTILLTPLAIVTSFLVIALLYRLLVAPRHGAGAELGFYLALVGTFGVFGGTLWGLRDETVPPGFEKPPAPELIEVD